MAKDTFPYWRANWRQNPYDIAANSIKNVIAAQNENRIPLQTDYTHTDIHLVVSPRIRQDLNNAARVKGDSFQQSQGVSRPGGLFDRLMSNLPTEDK